MITLQDIIDKRAELDVLVDAHTTTVEAGIPANIATSKQAVIIKGDEYAKLIGQYKSENPGFDESTVFSNPSKMTESIRDDIEYMMTTGLGKVSGLKMLMDTENNGRSPGGLTLVINSGIGSSVTVDWGDGTIETLDSGVAFHSHVYESPGLYDVIISGTRVVGGGIGSQTAIVEVKQWGQDFINENYSQFFYNSKHVQITAQDSPTFLPNTTCKEMFRNCDNFNSDISHWDVSNVVNMEGMFRNATSFDQPLASWNVSNVTNMSLMFYQASTFNQSLNGWDVNHPIDMSLMFHEASNFNGAVDQWSPHISSNMTQTFKDSNINQDLSHWLSGIYQPGIFINTPMEHSLVYHPSAT